MKTEIKNRIISYLYLFFFILLLVHVTVTPILITRYLHRDTVEKYVTTDVSVDSTETSPVDEVNE